MKLVVYPTYTNNRATKEEDKQVVVLEESKVLDYLFTTAVFNGCKAADNELVITFPTNNRDLMHVEIVNGYRE